MPGQAQTADMRTHMLSSIVHMPLTGWAGGLASSLARTWRADCNAQAWSGSGGRPHRLHFLSERLDHKDGDAVVASWDVVERYLQGQRWVLGRGRGAREGQKQMALLQCGDREGTQSSSTLCICRT